VEGRGVGKRASSTEYRTSTRRLAVLLGAIDSQPKAAKADRADLEFHAGGPGCLPPESRQVHALSPAAAGSDDPAPLANETATLPTVSAIPDPPRVADCSSRDAVEVPGRDDLFRRAAHSMQRETQTCEIYSRVRPCDWFSLGGELLAVGASEPGDSLRNIIEE
jgi:hypothetical protein